MVAGRRRKKKRGEGKDHRKHDQTYKQMYDHPRAIWHLLQHCYRWVDVDKLDRSSLAKLPTEYISAGSDGPSRKQLDMVWRIGYRSSGRSVLVTVEFQSKIDRKMAERVDRYTRLVHAGLEHQGKLDPGGARPLVLPLVLYNGKNPWVEEKSEPETGIDEKLEAGQRRGQKYRVLDMQRLVGRDLPERNLTSCLIRLESDFSADNGMRVLGEVERLLGGEGDEPVLEAFLDWFRWLGEQCDFAPEVLDKIRSMEDAKMMYPQVKEWGRELNREGIRIGNRRGVARGLARGRRLGRKEGQASLVSLVSRQVVLKFGEAAAAQIAGLLEAVDPAQLDRIGDLIIQCDSAQQFLAKTGVAP